jgi:hypothetical protein
MAFSSPKTWASGDTLTAADMNQYVRDQARWLLHDATGGGPMCRAYRSTTQSGVSSGTAITLDSERFDIGSMHDTVTNTSRLTVPASSGGKYLVGASVRSSVTASAANAEAGVQLIVNGTTNIALDLIVQEAVATRVWRLNFCTLYALAAADYVEAVVTFNGNVSNFDAQASSNYSPEVWAVWIGE